MFAVSAMVLILNAVKKNVAIALLQLQEQFIIQASCLLQNGFWQHTFLAFTVNASAQETSKKQETFKKVDEKVEAKTNLAALSEVVQLDAKLSQDLFGLFEY